MHHTETGVLQIKKFLFKFSFDEFFVTYLFLLYDFIDILLFLVLVFSDDDVM